MELTFHPTPLAAVSVLPTVRPAHAYAPCPCESGRMYRKCCEKGVQRATCAPPGAKTGFSHPGCYARALNDCSTKLSKEHTLSKGVLERLTINGGVQLKNFRFQDPGAATKLPVSAITARVLCDRHNAALSPLDQVGTAFFKRLEYTLRAHLGAVYEPTAALFNGHDVERWLLKYMAGKIAAGHDALDPGSIPAGWLEVLWGNRQLEPPDGLYFLTLKERPARLGFSNSIVQEEGRPVGCYTDMLTSPVVLLASGDGKQLPYEPNTVAFRPTILEAVGARPSVVTEFDWGDNRQLALKFAVNRTGNEDAADVPDCWRPKQRDAQ